MHRILSYSIFISHSQFSYSFIIFIHHIHSSCFSLMFLHHIHSFYSHIHSSYSFIIVLSFNHHPPHTSFIILHSSFIHQIFITRGVLLPGVGARFCGRHLLAVTYGAAQGVLLKGLGARFWAPFLAAGRGVC